MNNLTNGCIFCGHKKGLDVIVHLRTDQGLKPLTVRVCIEHLWTSHNLHEEVQEVIGDPIKWSNFWDE
ncbi:MAG: hypothetical protein KGY70_16925 [Bacteroidales bacterium]|nr:hypothetical protein [Bacteroidales bacterium]